MSISNLIGGGYRRRLMAAVGRKGPRQYTMTVYPSSLDENISEYDRYTNLNNALDSGSGNNYASFYWVKGSSAETHVYLNFDLSGIPAGATILEVSGKARVNTTGYQSTRWAERGVYLTAGTLRKSNGLWSNSLVSFSSPGEWTLEELYNAKLCYYIKRRSGSYLQDDFYMYVYGGSITVIYEI